MVSQYQGTAAVKGRFPVPKAGLVGNTWGEKAGRKNLPAVVLSLFLGPHIVQMEQGRSNSEVFPTPGSTAVAGRGREGERPLNTEKRDLSVLGEKTKKQKTTYLFFRSWLLLLQHGPKWGV